jgi:hypothetical protein
MSHKSILITSISEGFHRIFFTVLSGSFNYLAACLVDLRGLRTKIAMFCIHLSFTDWWCPEAFSFTDAADSCKSTFLLALPFQAPDKLSFAV